MVVECFLERIDEFADALELHAFALVVEVKVRVVRPGVVESLHRVLKRLLDRELVALLIDEVDEVQVSVQGNLVRDVRLDGGRLGDEQIERDDEHRPR